MKKYFTNISGSKNRNELELTVDGKVLFKGKPLEYESKFINDNVLVLRIGNRNYFLSVTENEDNDLLEVNLDSGVYELDCKSELEIKVGKMNENKSDKLTKKKIHSPMPGIIKSVNVSEGQAVKKGQVLMVLEAMKMENEIKAGGECVIKNVNVKVMSSVDKNELLLELE